MSECMLPTPISQTVEFIKKMLVTRGQLSKVEELADRGIILNTWQVNHLLLDGDRQVGKTFLSYVRVAESCKTRGAKFTMNQDLTEWDPDLITHVRQREWLFRLPDFINTYYSDVYTTTKANGNEVVLVPIKKEQDKRWWL